MAEIASIGGYTGSVTLVDQDGQGWKAWCQAGQIQVPADGSFMVVPAPLPGCVWQQVEIDTKEGKVR